MTAINGFVPAPTDARPGDVDHLVRDDHAVVERQLQHLEARRGERRVLVDQVAFELAVHATAEEGVLYPAYAEAGLDDDADHARRDHQRMKELLAVLERERPGDAIFEESLIELADTIRPHVDEEERLQLPRLREALGPRRMAELGEHFLAVKRTAPTFPHPGGPSSATGHRLLDLATVAVDKVRDKVSGRQDGLATDASGLLDADAQQLLDRFSEQHPLPLEILTPDLARHQPTLGEAAADVAADASVTAPDVFEDELRIEGPDGDELSLRIFRPAGRDDGTLRPGVLWIHSGGWVLFDEAAAGASCRFLADAADAVVVSPDYRRAPEHPVPAAHEDVLATWRWLRDHAADIGADPEALVIGGESVGGAMAVSTTLQLMAAGDPLPLAVVSAYPLVTTAQFGESFADSADARPLNRPLVSWMAMHAFGGHDELASDPRIELLATPLDQLAKMPPTLVFTADRDPLRSQGEAFANRLRDAGAPVSHRPFAGVPHEFLGANAVVAQGREALVLAAQHVQAAARSTEGPV